MQGFAQFWCSVVTLVGTLGPNLYGTVHTDEGNVLLYTCHAQVTLGKQYAPVAIKNEPLHIGHKLAEHALLIAIPHAQARVQDFGEVDSAYIRLIDARSDEELVRFDLPEDAGDGQSAIFGELSRRDGEWVFRALGTGLGYGLGTVARNYGVERS